MVLILQFYIASLTNLKGDAKKAPIVKKDKDDEEGDKKDDKKKKRT